MKIEYIDIDDIHEYKNNAKRHNTDQIEQIKKSISEYGFNDPVVIWKNNEIIEGHGRILAAKELGIKKIPVIRLDDLSDEQRKAYALIHNKLTLDTDMDEIILESELLELSKFGIDMKEFGLDLNDDFSGKKMGDFFEDAPQKVKNKKKIQCPHCGKWFEI